MGPGHDWRRNDAGDWYCINCHVVTAMSVRQPADDQKFTPRSLTIHYQIPLEDLVKGAVYSCEEMQVLQIHAS